MFEKKGALIGSKRKIQCQCYNSKLRKLPSVEMLLAQNGVFKIELKKKERK